MSQAIPPETTTRFMQLDDEGYFKNDGLRIADADAARNWLALLEVDSKGRSWSSMDGSKVLIEAFDEPFIALDITKSSALEWTITMPYGYSEELRIDSITVDEWDRFHGQTKRGIPFVLSRAAQARFFNLLDEFDDESITVNGQRLATLPWMPDRSEANTSISGDAEFWNARYRNQETQWDLGEVSPALPKMLPRLKLQRSRILVPGAGSGNDAAWFAEQGHLVTAVDFSAEAVARAQQKYGHIPNLKFIQADIFALPQDMIEAFDIVFEHTLYCAIPPSRRSDLVKVWRRVLAQHGHLLGVFFTMDKRTGPPFGGSEWELRSRLQSQAAQKGFRILYWNRLRDSKAERLGQELFVYAQKLDIF